MNKLKKNIGIFCALGLVWGSAFVAIEVLVHQLPPWVSAALRLGVASTALYVIVLLRKSTIKIPSSLCLKVWGAGLLAVGFPFSCLFWSEQRVSAGLAGILNGTVPIWTSLMLLFYQARRSNRSFDMRTLSGVALGFFGLWIIFYPHISLGSSHDELAGGLGLLMMALSYALSNVANRKILMEHKHLALETVIFHQHFVSFLFVLALSLLFETWPAVDQIFALRALFPIIYLGVVSSALAYLMYFYLLKEIGAVQTASVTYLIPLVALGLDILIQGHIPEASSLGGVCFILIGLFFIRSSKPV